MFIIISIKKKKKLEHLRTTLFNVVAQLDLLFFIDPSGGSSEPSRRLIKKIKNKKRRRRKSSNKMAAPAGRPGPCGASLSPLSAEAPVFVPLAADCWRLGSQFSRCASRLRGLRPDGGQLKEELNMLFDQLLSENHSRSPEPGGSVRAEVGQRVAATSRWH